MSSDGSHVFFRTSDRLSPLDTDGRLDLYERFGGQTRFLSSGGNGNFDVSKVVITPDGSRAYFTTTEGLCCGDNDLTEDVYESAGGVVSLVSIEPAGHPSFTGANLLTALDTSDDGSRVFFEWRKPTSGTLVEFFERTAGQTTQVFGQPPNVDGFSGMFFCGISADGSRFRVSTSESFDPSDTDGRGDIYERVGGVTTLLSTGPADTSGAFDIGCTASWASTDGLHVVFETTAPLVAEDADGVQTDLYERSGGVTTLLSVGPSGGNGAFLAGGCAVSADGLHVFFFTQESLVASDTDSAYDVYERTGGQTLLASTGPAAGDGNQDAGCMGATGDGLHMFFTTEESLVAADGDLTVDFYERTAGQTILASDSASGLGEDIHFFSSNVARDANALVMTILERLLPTDTDDTWDVYAWDGQRVRLVSTGAVGGNGDFAALQTGPTSVSDDGATIAFRTQEALVSSDTGNGFDLYLARAVAGDDETQTAPPGGTVSTGGSPTAGDPIETSVTTPDGGDVTIVEEEAGDPPAGFNLVGMQVNITAPPATPPESLTLAFRLDGSLLAPLGLDYTSVLVFKDGNVVGECTSTVPADPDPCVADRTALGSGGAEITVRTTSASLWQFGEEQPSDTTPPVITPTVVGTLGSNGWYTSNVDVSWSVEDAESAISSQTGCDPTAISTDTAGLLLTCEASSAGGTNSASITIRRDAMPPTLTCQASTFVIGGAGGNVAATIADPTSGPAATSVSQPANVASAGVKSASLTGFDLAGNQRTVSCSYVVRFGFPGFQSPAASTSYKAGSSIPIKFALTNAAGATISDASAQALANACGVRISFTGGDPIPACASYDAKADLFQFDLKTAKSLRGPQTIIVRVFIGTGLVNTQSIVVQLKA
jgi:hypothetical protein